MDPDVHISALPAGTHVWSALGGSMLHPHVPPQVERRHTTCRARMCCTKAGAAGDLSGSRRLHL